MSHGITETDSQVFAFKPAWHGLGKVVDHLIEIEHVNEEAGLTWLVEKQPGYALGKRARQQRILAAMERYKADPSEANFETVGRLMGFRPASRSSYLVRMDTGEPLKEVGERYEIWQNSGPVEFAQELLDRKQIMAETAGSIQGGRKVWWLFHLPRNIRIGGDDRERIGQYLCICNNHDGSGSAVIYITGVRVQCQNTITYSIKTAKRAFKLRHTPGMQERVAEAQEALGMAVTYMKAFAQIGNELANTPMSEGQFLAFLDEWMPLPEVKDPAASIGYRNTVENRRAVTDIYFEADNLRHVRNTRYAALNAVSQFLTHEKPGRNGVASTAAESRLVRTMFDGDPLNDKALMLLTR